MSKSVNVDFVTRQIEVDTDGKEHFISAAMAAKDAEQSMLNAQNAANTAEKIATDLGLVDEAVQTAVDSATTASNKADVATAKADVATTKASEASASADTATQKADIATAKAEAANASASNAAHSYANADAIATQLTEYLATKESLTAPAVDKTLLIEGAAADSKVVGELKSDLNTHFIKEITSADNPSEGAVNPESGTILQNDAYNYVTFNVFGAKTVRYNAAQAESKRGFCFYKIDDQPIIPGVDASATEIILQVPDDAVYAKATYRVVHANDFYVYVDFDVKTLSGHVVEIKEDAIQTEGEVAGLTVKTQDLDYMKAVSATPETGYVSTENGTIAVNQNYKYIEFPVIGNVKCFYKGGQNESSNVGIAFYDADWKFIPGSGVKGSKTEQIITVPDNACHARASYVALKASDFYVKLLPCFTDIFSDLDEHTEKLTGFIPEFVMPAYSVAVVGHEWNCYFDNIIIGMDFGKYAVKATITPSGMNVGRVKLYERTLRITPTEADIGDKTITLTVINKNGARVVASKSFTLHVIADITITSKKVLFLGDSLTNAGIFAAEIQHIMTEGGLVSIGTRSTTCKINNVNYTVNHEGRPGWAAYDYTRTMVGYRTDLDNPFWDGEKFDFAYYMAHSGVDIPDIICVGLGTNGANAAGISAMQIIVDSIRAYNANIPIIVSLIGMPATQDGCGYSVLLQSAAQLKINFLNVNANYITDYDGNVQRPNVTLADLCFQLDTQHDYNTVNIPVSARNPEIITIQSNNVHPSEYGYLHFADGYYNQIVYVLSQS